MPLFNTTNYQPSGRRIRLLPILLFAVFAAVYYFGNQTTNPITGRKQLISMSSDDEMALGLQTFRSILSQSRVIQSGPEAEMITRVGKRIAAVTGNTEYQWDFRLIDSDQANAFCLPGGKVAVYSGILPIAKSEDGLAVVMGHEIAHAISRHGAERMAQEQLAQFGQIAVSMATQDMDYNQRRMVMGALGVGTQFGVLLPFSRKHESEADYIGLRYMAEACFNPQEAVSFWQRMGNQKQGGSAPEFMSTHPSDNTRIAQIQQWMPEILQIRSEHCK